MTKTIATALVVLALATGEMGFADRARAEEIRREYRGTAAPDHLMFAAFVRSMRETREWNSDIALDIVRKQMKLESGEAAEAFLARMVAAADELDADYEKAWDSVLCGQDSPRTREAMYHALDFMDDLYAIKDHNIYLEFVTSLEPQQQKLMDAWLEEGKEGLYYRAAKHESMYGESVDIVGLVDMQCEMKRRSARG